MKKIFSIFAAILFAGSLMAEDITLTGASGFKSGYNNAGTLTVSEVEFAFNAGVMYNQKGSPANAAAKSFIQFRKSGSGAGEVKNNTEMSLKTITVATQNTNAFTLSAGTAADDLAAVDPTVSTGKYAFKDKDNKDAECDVTIYTFDVEGQKYFSVQNTGNALYIAYITIELGGAAPAVAKPTITPEANPFLGSTPVTLACETPGASIFYTLDGNDPDNTSNEYSVPFVVDKTTTVKAIAFDGTNYSAIASKEITGLTVLSTMDAIFEAASATASTQYIAFNDWIVTGVSSNGKNVFVTDGTKGFVINDGNGEMGFEANDVLSGTVQVSLKKNSGYAQVTGLKATTTGLNVDEGGVPTLNVLDADGIAALTGVNTGSLIQIQGAYSTTGANKHFVAGVQVFCGNSGICASYPDEFNADSEYKVTGVYQIYNTTNEVLPRALTDIEEVITGPAIKADDIALGEVWVVDDNPYETIRGLSVTGLNLTEAIKASTSSEGLTIVSEALTEYGGTIEVEINAPLGVFEGTISLTSGDLIKPVKVTATIRKKNVVPATALDPIVDPDKGEYASAAQVKFDDEGVDYDGVKVGTGDNDGSALIVVGPGAETLYFYALAWKAKAGDIQLSAPAGITLWAPEMDAEGKIALMASDGINTGSPFTVEDIYLEDMHKCLYAITLSGVTAETTITVSSGTARRFVLFNIKQVGGSPATALEDVTIENTAVKQIINNQVIITRDGVRYNVIGQIVK